MRYMGAILGGVIAGAIGAAVWAGIAIGTGYEIGWIAWGIGALVGFGVLVGGKGQAGGMGAVIAILLAVLSIMVGKYATVHMAVSELIAKGSSSEYAQEIRDSMNSPEGAELLTSYVADSVAEEWEGEGRAVNWPAGIDPYTGVTKDEYPPDVWLEAASRLRSMNPMERRELEQYAFEDAMAGLEMIPAVDRQLLTMDIFRSTFGLMDILFFGLAILTAGKLGASENDFSGG
ncbi:MAG: hypothetical protein KC983_04770 [Phycisphaerales bacterium]|nr:hypothetical protein [Phycisphaerales bacterium]